MDNSINNPPQWNPDTSYVATHGDDGTGDTGKTAGKGKGKAGAAPTTPTTGNTGTNQTSNTTPTTTSTKVQMPTDPYLSSLGAAAASLNKYIGERYAQDQSNPSLSTPNAMTPEQISAAMSDMKDQISFLMPGISAAYFTVLMDLASIIYQIMSLEQKLEVNDILQSWAQTVLAANATIAAGDAEAAGTMAQAVSSIISGVVAGLSYVQSTRVQGQALKMMDEEIGVATKGNNALTSGGLKNYQNGGDSDPILQAAKDRGALVKSGDRWAPGRDAPTGADKITPQEVARMDLQNDINSGKITVDTENNKLVVNEQRCAADGTDPKSLQNRIDTDLRQNRSLDEFQQVGTAQGAERKDLLQKRITDNTGTDLKPDGTTITGAPLTSSQQRRVNQINADKAELAKINDPNSSIGKNIGASQAKINEYTGGFGTTGWKSKLFRSQMASQKAYSQTMQIQQISQAMTSINQGVGGAIQALQQAFAAHYQAANQLASQSAQIWSNQEQKAVQSFQGQQQVLQGIWSNYQDLQQGLTAAVHG